VTDDHTTATSRAAPVSYEAGAARPERIEIRGVTHTFVRGKKQTVAVADIDLTVEPGEFVMLVGPSGCGKTTILKMIAGFFTPTTGQVLVNGEPVQSPGADRGMVFQQPTLFPWQTVRGNVEIGPRMRGTSKEECREISSHYLELVGLADVAEQRPQELSGGMQQRAAIARALANDPAIVLMDEPFGALDAMTREHLQQEVKQIWTSTGKSIVFVTHSVQEAVFLGTRIVVLSPRPGRIIYNEVVDLPHHELSVNEALIMPEFAALRHEISGLIGQTIARTAEFGPRP
jgi:NitT/TauT family transport system ATP-binding protein/taurine transport system ATP-binding protein